MIQNEEINIKLKNMLSQPMKWKTEKVINDIIDSCSIEIKKVFVCFVRKYFFLIMI